MIYIDNSTKIIEIPRISLQIGEKAVFVNQTTKAEISVEFADDGNGNYYKVPIEDNIKYLDAGQYDYYILNNSGDNIAGGILQFDDFGRDLVEYSDDISVIQYTPDDEYNPIHDRVLDITENGRYNVKNYDAVDVDIVFLFILPSGIRFDGSTWTVCPSFDYSNITMMDYMFSGNVNLLSVGEMKNATKATTTKNMFFDCHDLKICPSFDTSNVTSMNYMFGFCYSLTTVPLLNAGKVNDIDNMFGSGRKELTTIGGFTDMGKSFTTSNILDINRGHLTNDSVQNIIDTVYDMNNNTTGGSATLKLNSSVVSKMTYEQKAQLAAKRWTLTS